MWKRWCALAAVALAVGVAARTIHSPATSPSIRIDACDIVPAELLSEIGASGARRPFDPEGPGRGATGCSFGERDPAVHATAFAVSSGGRQAVERQREMLANRKVRYSQTRGAEFSAYKWPGPTPNSESIVVLRGDHYANVILFNAEQGTIDRLIQPVAANL